mmetsp:Transcript_29763/g.54512  ORF Transcript_29763/g.54512 Transcript_29763/m.54512 type:complete len:467 (+) Transcript_29763:1672-3072(+)
MSSSSQKQHPSCPKFGPEPLLLSRSEVDALYEILDAVVDVLTLIKADYIVTGGSLLGAVRQHSILFCDDDIDIAIFQEDYERVSKLLPILLDSAKCRYTKRPWEGGDKIRHARYNTVFVDLFTIRKYNSLEELKLVIGVKANGQSQPEEYTDKIVHTIETASKSQNESSPLYPFWHFNTRKAIEMWPKEVYRHFELFPLLRDYKMGPLSGISGPRMPVLLLQRAFGLDCFEVYYRSASHQSSKCNSHLPDGSQLPPLVLEGGNWEGGVKEALRDEHYFPMQPISRSKRRPTLHNRTYLMDYLKQQRAKEAHWQHREELKRPRRTIYMDGVFDLFHVGHLEAIRQCAVLGDRVIIGVTGDADAGDYKRPPIFSEEDRTALVKAVKEVDQVVCPCPLIVSQEFMESHQIDLVVHGFANEEDAQRQHVFFEDSMRMGKFQRIEYYRGLSTTDIIQKIKSLPEYTENEDG